MRKRERSTDAIRREREGVILCFVGPQVSARLRSGSSIAACPLGAKVHRASLGGVRDEAEIRGPSPDVYRCHARPNPAILAADRFEKSRLHAR